MKSEEEIKEKIKEYKQEAIDIAQFDREAFNHLKHLVDVLNWIIDNKVDTTELEEIDEKLYGKEKTTSKVV